jgi:acetolactate decarboxylase
MHTLQIKLPQSLWTALLERARAVGEPVEHVVRSALADYVGAAHNTLFQISTSGALVNGIYRGAVDIGQLREHGGFGLGTFEGLDGEMVAFDGYFYQVRADGTVRVAQDGDLTPFAVVVDFHPATFMEVAHCADLSVLQQAIDGARESDNLFYAIRIDGHFDTIHTRAMCKAAEGVPLAVAAAHQPEFKLHDVTGTMVGFWSPRYVTAIEVPGYHLHFITADRSAGGHLLDCAGGPLRVQIEKLDELRMALPINDEFLRADLSRDPTRDLAFAERDHGAGQDK